MRVMRYTMAVRNPETYEVHALLKGSEVPSWAESVVDDRDTEQGKPAPKVSASSAPPEPVVEAVVPDASWTAAAIRKYAVEHSVDLGEATTKADMLAAIEAA